MIRSLIKLGLFLVAGILVYNYFFGTPEEKAQSKEVFSNVKNLTKSAVDLLRTEKTKFDEGKYDDAVDKISGVIDDLKGKAQKLDDNRELLGQIAELESKQRQLSQRVQEENIPQSYDNTRAHPKMDSASQKEIENEWDDLVRKTERLISDMERKADQQEQRKQY